MPADQWDGMQRVFRESALPVIADESCIVESDVPLPRTLPRHQYQAVQVRRAHSGPAHDRRSAQSWGLQVMVGCMTESTVGISAIAQLLPLLDYVDMDGALLLAEDIATGVTSGARPLRVPAGERQRRAVVRHPPADGCGRGPREVLCGYHARREHVVGRPSQAVWAMATGWEARPTLGCGRRPRWET